MSDGLAVKSKTYAKAAPGANTNILTTALTPTYGGYFQIFVVLATGSVFNMTVTDGSTAYTVGLNKSTALQAGDGYTFTVLVDPSYSYNFQVETDGIIRQLLIHEISNPVGLPGAQGNAT